ncbi:MAG TPA: ribosomal L7Ae/L30e/S12e/Gadd45 family protein [Longimicrobium sp.]|nr:ribosomal L7Ae/L30e/S12e/Gadd45 family protein [Longimicrobium sp.]
MNGAERPPARSGSPERALLDLLGLAARARGLVHGMDAARKGVRDGEVLAVVLAADTSPTQSHKLVPLLEARGTPYVVCLTREQVGAALGRPAVSAVGLTNPSFAKRAMELAAALAHPRDAEEESHGGKQH